MLGLWTFAFFPFRFVAFFFLWLNDGFLTLYTYILQDFQLFLMKKQQMTSFRRLFRNKFILALDILSKRIDRQSRSITKKKRKRKKKKTLLYRSITITGRTMFIDSNVNFHNKIHFVSDQNAIYKRKAFKWQEGWVTPIWIGYASSSEQSGTEWGSFCNKIYLIGITSF